MIDSLSGIDDWNGLYDTKSRRNYEDKNNWPREDVRCTYIQREKERKKKRRARAHRFESSILNL